MKLSEKIVALRKQSSMTQEELAELCNVSRQSVSKWEADMALPEVDKLLLMSQRFQVSLDVLLKDELMLSEVKDIHHCGANALQGKQPLIYEGLLIKESVTDDRIIDWMKVHKLERRHAQVLDGPVFYQRSAGFSKAGGQGAPGRRNRELVCRFPGRK